MISIIVAIAKNRVIGGDNKLLWHLSEDLKNFKRITSGHPVVMGRKTFESFSKALPNRRNVVITRNPDFKAQGAEVVGSLKAALDLLSTPTQQITTENATTYQIPTYHIPTYQIPTYQITTENTTTYQVTLSAREQEIFIIGGGEIYRQALPLADKLYITEVDLTPPGDTTFPEIPESEWCETLREVHAGFTFTEYERCGK